MSVDTVLICARGGSKGLPGKNIKILAGKPLIAHSIEAAKKISSVNRIIVSTDSETIADVAREYGAEVPFVRPTNLSGDNVSEWAVWQHALGWMGQYDVCPASFLVLPPTAPLRQPIDIENALNLFKASEADGVLCATDAHRHPCFNMVASDASGRCRVAIDNGKKTYRRQDVEKLFDVTTVCYVLRSAYVLDNNHLFDGKIFMQHVPRERSIDIDTQFDFDIAEFLIQRNEP